MPATQVPSEHIHAIRDDGLSSRRRFMSAAAASVLTAGGLWLPNSQPTVAQEFSATARERFVFGQGIVFQDLRPSIPYETSFVSVPHLRGRITRIRVSLIGLQHTNLSDLDFRLLAPNGASIALISDVGVGANVTNLSLIIDAAGTILLPPTGQVLPGVYAATNYDGGNDAMPPPSPLPNAVFPNLLGIRARSVAGPWYLFIYDKVTGNTGSMQNWSLEIRTSNRRPIAHPDTYTVEQGNLLTVSAGRGVLRNDRDPDRDRLRVTPINRNHRLGRLVLRSDGSFTFRAVPNRTGVARFNYKVSDRELSDIGILTIRVRP